MTTQNNDRHPFVLGLRMPPDKAKAQSYIGCLVLLSLGLLSSLIMDSGLPLGTGFHKIFSSLQLLAFAYQGKWLPAIEHK